MQRELPTHWRRDEPPSWQGIELVGLENARKQPTLEETAPAPSVSNAPSRFRLLCIVIFVLGVALFSKERSHSGTHQISPVGGGKVDEANGSWTNATVCSTCSLGRHSLRFRVIVINLQRRPDRLQRFLNELRRGPASLLSTCICRLSAVDGHSHEALERLVEHGLVSSRTVSEAEQGAAVGGDSLLTAGAIGCYASHWHAMRLIADDETLDFGLIAEDDLIRYSPVFWSHFSKLWNNSKGDATQLWQNSGFIYLQSASGDWTVDMQRGLEQTELVEAGWPKNTALYATSREAALYLTGSRSTGTRGCILPIWTQLDSFLPGGCPDIIYKRFDPPIAQQIGATETGGDTDVQLHGNEPLMTSLGKVPSWLWSRNVSGHLSNASKRAPIQFEMVDI